MNKDFEPHPFITYLESLQENRGALAALRRGLGQPPGGAPEMFPYIIPHLPKDLESWRERIYYSIASLFALHPESSSRGNLGDHFTRARGAGGSEEAVERRFVALLSAHPDDLDFYLRQAISFLRSREIPVNWHQLFRDILYWSHPGRFVQKQWATSFWSPSPAEQSSNI